MQLSFVWASSAERSFNTKVQSNPFNPKVQSNPFNTKVQSNPFNTKVQSNPFNPKVRSNPFNPKVQSNPFNPKVQSNPSSNDFSAPIIKVNSRHQSKDAFTHESLLTVLVSENYFITL